VQTTIPVPAAYLYLKGLACAERDSKQRSYKFKKDLWSVYFIAERTPENDRQDLYERLRKYKQKDEEQFNYFRSNLEKYFKSENSRGPKACERLTNMTGGFVRKRAVAVIKTLLDNIKD
jgi:hypothetical protein